MELSRHYQKSIHPECQRFLLYLNAAASSSEDFEHLSAVGGTLRSFANRLAQIWPEAVDPPYYPAFR